MLDGYGRNIDYLRVSVTDKCNYRCRYCMPATGVDYIEHENILRIEELIYLTEIFADLGIKKIKITGGEPLVRKGILTLIKGMADIKGISDITMTSNGYYLQDFAKDLKNLGLSCINVSIDTMDKYKYEKICKADGLEKVLGGIDKALEEGLKIKINATLGEHTSKKDIIGLLNYGKEKNIIIRFIEMMPIGLGRVSDINGNFVKELVREEFGEVRDIAFKTNGPATYYEAANGIKFGLIEAVHNKFCFSCNRLRLTADGKIKPCLAYDEDIDIREDLRRGRGKKELREKISKALYAKPVGHNFKNCKANSLMNGIGG